CLVYLFHVLNTGNDNMVFLFLYVDQVVRVIVIQKTLIEHAEKFRQVKAVLEENLLDDAGRKFLRDIQEGSTEAVEVGW
ncbi:unnamed protein product, partial [Brassica rapa]